MDDEVKRRIAASLDQPLDPKRDRDAIRALEKDPQAKAWAEGLKKVESALRRWPAPARTAAQWEDFASQIERRLVEVPSEVSFDPFAPPVLEGDDGDATHAEPNSMAQSPDKNDDDDLEALAALTRSSSAPTTSMAPPPPVKAGPSLHDDLMDESSGIVDMKQLAELALKQPAPPPASALSPTAADAGSSSDAAVMAGEKPTARAAKPAATGAAAVKTGAPVDIATARAAQPAKKGPSVALWLTPILAAAAVGGFVFFKSAQRSEPTESASRAEPSTESQNAAPGAAAQTAPAAPSVVAIAPAQPVAAPSGPMPAPAVAPTEQPSAPPERPAAAEAAAAPAPTVAAPANVALAAPPAEPAPAAHIAGAGHAADSETRHAAHTTGAVALADTTAAADERAAPAAHGSRGGPTAAPVVAAAPAPTPAPATTVAAAPHATAAPAVHPGTATTADGHPRSMDDLMAQAVGGSHTAAAPAAASTGSSSGGGGAAAPAASGELPERLSRAQVTATMAPLSAAVRACTQGATGMATVAMVILHDGSVQNASVSGPFTADANNCIAGVVRRAHFPQFTRPSVPMMYPFSIQPAHPGGN